MFGGLRPYRLNPINRGCVNTVTFLVQKPDGTWVDKTNKKLYLTAKTQPWDDDADDSDAVFKVVGTIPNPTKEPGRVVFTLTEEQCYLDPDKLYFVDIVETGSTLKENGLDVLEEICPLSARMIVNQVSMQMYADRIKPLIAQLKRELEKE